MKLRGSSILMIAGVGLTGFLLLKTSIAVSQWSVPQSGQEPAYKISDNFGVVVNSEKRGVAEGFFVMRAGNRWLRFEAQNAPRTMPVAP
jgi:hypothetical protein